MAFVVSSKTLRLVFTALAKPVKCVRLTVPDEASSSDKKGGAQESLRMKLIVKKYADYMGISVSNVIED